MHRTPYLTSAELASLSPIGAKVLCCLGARGAWDRWITGRVCRWARRLMISERAWERAVAELMDFGLIRYQWTTTGFEALIVPRRQFTAIGRFGDDRLLRMSPRAAKVLLALARRADNRSRSCRQRLATIARAICRGVRTVGLGLEELERLRIVERHRTGRACWFVLCTAPADEIDRFAPDVAHRSRLLLRLLITSTRDELLGAFRAVSRPGVARALRLSGLCDHAGSAGYASANRYCRMALERLGVSPPDAHALVIQYGPEDVEAVLQGRGDRRADRLARWVERAIRRRWNLPDTAP